MIHINLKFCSLTGADGAVDPAALRDVSREFPFVEWAILLLPAQQGNPRCPTTGWIEKFKSVCADTHKAMHLCDDAFLQFMESGAEVREVMTGFRRIQLNLKFGNLEGKYDPADLVARIKESPEWEFIIQYTPEKAFLLKMLEDVPNHAVLFDASAGRGISPDRWDPPIAGHFCGYAGGIGPENIAENLRQIGDVTQGIPTWIDMESRIRTDDKFDFAKVRTVLEAVQAVMQPGARPGVSSPSRGM